MNVVWDVVSAGRERVNDLITMGVNFIRDESGEFSLGREGGHSHRRVAHAYDLTGRQIEQTLLSYARRNNNITLCEEHMALDLLIKKTDSAVECYGCYVMEPSGQITPYTAMSTILSTGGSGKVYLYTSNPDIATGDGVAMAFRAGAKIANMEFVSSIQPACITSMLKTFLYLRQLEGKVPV